LSPLGTHIAWTEVAVGIVLLGHTCFRCLIQTTPGTLRPVGRNQNPFTAQPVEPTMGSFQKSSVCHAPLYFFGRRLNWHFGTSLPPGTPFVHLYACFLLHTSAHYLKDEAGKPVSISAGMHNVISMQMITLMQKHSAAPENSAILTPQTLPQSFA